MMTARKGLVTGLLIVGLSLSVWLVFGATLASAATTCPDGSPGPCAEDVLLGGPTQVCYFCHSIRIAAGNPIPPGSNGETGTYPGTQVPGGNRDGTDRQITVSAGAIRHELDISIADWTSIVDVMIGKGSKAVLELTAGYLNTNYCTTCTGPILGSPQALKTDVTDKTAKVTWSTSATGFGDEPTNGVLFYGTNKDDVLLGPSCSSCKKAEDTSSPSGHHVINLTGLESNTAYYMVNQSTSSRLGTTTSKYAISFRTTKPVGNCNPPVPSRIYLSNNSSTGPKTIVAIDPITNTEIVSIPVTGGDPGELAAHPNGRTLYASVGDGLAIIDVLDNFVQDTLVGVGGLFNQVVVAPNGSKVYVASRRTTGTATLDVKIVDTASNTVVGTITDPVFNGCYAPLGLGIHPAGSKLYLACRPSDSSLPDRFFLVDAATNAVSQTATFGRDNNLPLINAITVKPDGSKVYLARNDNTASTVEIFDGATGANAGSIPLPSSSLPRAGVVTLDGSKLYVTDQRLGTHVIDTATNTLLTTLTQTKSRGLDIAMNKNGTRLYMTLGSILFAWDATTNTWIATVTGSFSSVFQITTTPGAAREGTECPVPIPSRVYLSNNPSTGSKAIVAIDLATSTVLPDSIPVSGNPGELAASPDGSKVYAMVGSNLLVIDVLNNKVLNTVPSVGGSIGNFNHVVVHPDGSKVYVASTDPYVLKVNVIDTETNTVQDTITDSIFNGCYATLGLGIRPDGSKLYIACRPVSGLDRFFLIDTGTNSPKLASSFTRDSTNNATINAMAVSPDGAKVYLARKGSTGSTVEIFDGSTGAKQGSIPTPFSDSFPYAVAVKQDGSRIYVVDPKYGTYVFDPVAKSLVARLDATNSKGLDIGMTPDGSHLYITLASNCFVWDVATNTRITTITGSFSAAKQFVITPGFNPPF